METQALRLQFILNELQITPYKFSKLLGYKSPDTIYHILNGKQEISTNMQKRIRELNIEINENWILTGKGSPFIKKLIKGVYGDEYASNGIIIYPARLKFGDIRKLAKYLSEKIFLDNEEADFEVKYRVSGIEGLEFIFTTLNYDKKTKKNYLDKHFSIIISPEWKVISFFDFWRVNEPTRRCQNLLNITNSNRTEFIDTFEAQIREFLDNVIDETYFNIDEIKEEQSENLESYDKCYTLLFKNYPQHSI